MSFPVNEGEEKKKKTMFKSILVCRAFYTCRAGAVVISLAIIGTCSGYFLLFHSLSFSTLVKLSLERLSGKLEGTGQSTLNLFKFILSRKIYNDTDF